MYLLVCTKAPLFKFFIISYSDCVDSYMTESWTIGIPLSSFSQPCIHYNRCPWQFWYSSTSDIRALVQALKWKLLIVISLLLEWSSSLTKFNDISSQNCMRISYIGVMHVIQWLESSAIIWHSVFCVYLSVSSLRMGIACVKACCCYVSWPLCINIPQTWSCSPINVVSQLFILH